MEATMIPRMIVTYAFSDRTEFSVTTGSAVLIHPFCSLPNPLTGGCTDGRPWWRANGRSGNSWYVVQC